MNEIQNWTDDLFKKYSAYATNDKAETDVKLLSADQIALIEKCLNTAFINPKFKMEHFVTSGQLTPYSTIRQWMLELKTMEENCEQFEYMLKKSEIDQKIQQLEIERATDELVRSRHEGELLKIKHDYDRNKRRLAQHYIEREQFIQLMQEYLAGPNGKTPEGKSWLDVFGDMDEENRWEKHYWTVRLAQQAAMDVVSYGRIGSGNLDAITQLPAQQREEAIALTHEVSLRIENISGALRKQVHEKLLKTDPIYAQVMHGKDVEEINKIEFNVNDLIPTVEKTLANGATSNTNPDEDILNVYRS